MRGAAIGEPVDIYWNLHEHTFSVRSRRSSSDYGRVIDHVPTFILTDASFIVQPRGREKVLVKRQKNVHAFVRGLWQVEVPDEYFLATEPPSFVRYNPYEAGTYLAVNGGHSVYGASCVIGWIDGIKPKLQAHSLDFSLRKW